MRSERPRAPFTAGRSSQSTIRHCRMARSKCQRAVGSVQTCRPLLPSGSCLTLAAGPPASRMMMSGIPDRPENEDKMLPADGATQEQPLPLSSKRLLLEATVEELRPGWPSEGHPAYRARQVLDWVIRRRAESFEPMSDLPLGSGSSSTPSGRVFGTRVALSQPFARRDRQAPAGVSRRPADRVRADGRGAAADRLHQHAGRLRHGLRLLRQRPEGGRAEPDRRRDRRAGAPAAEPPAAGRAVTHIVVMGMGESLANLDNLIAALDRICSAEEGLGIEPAPGDDLDGRACRRRSASWRRWTGSITWRSRCTRRPRSCGTSWCRSTRRSGWPP